MWFVHKHGENSSFDHSEEIKYLRRGVQSCPVSADTLNNLGNVYFMHNNRNEARKCYVRALKLCPNHRCALTNLGIAFAHKGMIREALCCFRASVNLCPTFIETLNNLGLVMTQCGYLSIARELYDDLVKTQNNLPPEVYLNHGIAHSSSLKGSIEAESFRIALRANPNCVKAIENIASIYMDVDRFDECILCCERALEIMPNNISTLSKLLFASASICEFETLLETKKAFTDLLLDECRHENLFAQIHPMIAQMVPCFRESNFLDIAIAHAARISSTSGSLFNIFPLNKSEPRPRHNGRIKIGYLSSKFGNSDIGHLIGGIFSLHDRQSFEVFCYSLSRDDYSPWFKAVEDDADHFMDFSSTENIDAAVRIRRDDIDILIDLDGFTTVSCPEILSFQPAPLQINYLGHFGTSGASYIQYVVVDETIAAEADTKDKFTEKALVMPSCAIVNDHMRYSSTTVLEVENFDESFDRSMFGISEDVFLYACFHPLHCLTSEIFEAWIEILKRTDGSVLWIAQSNPSAEKNLRMKAKSLGLLTERIVFSDPAPYYDNLMRYNLVDLVLGGLEVLGGITVGVDAIWSGTPIITLMGEQMHNRIEASYLRNAGLGDSLIAKSVDEYIDLAVHLNFDEFRYMELIKRLEYSHERSQSELFDTCKWIRCFELGLLNAYDNFQSDRSQKNS